MAEKIDYSKLTHINIAFENPINDLGEMSFRPDTAVLIEAAHQHKVSVLVSIGGGSASEDSTMIARYRKLLSPEQRQAFVKKLGDFVVEHKFDGIDVDIEGPAIDESYGPFIEALSAELRPRGKLLTAALSKGYGGSKVPNSVFEYFDFLNIMAYDAVGSWNPNQAGQHSSLEFSKENVDYWLQRGLPKEKAVLGLPFYGYGFGADFVPGGISYNAILERHPGAETVDEIGSTIWYNGIPTIKLKTSYAMRESLGGVMIWSLEQDATGDKSLLQSITEALQKRESVAR